MKAKLTILLLFFWGTGIAQNQGLSLNDCRDRALEHNRKIKMAHEHELTLGALRKYAKTQYFPNFSINGGYMRMNREISLLSEDIFLPVVPQASIVNGSFNQLVFFNHPELLAETFVLNPDGSIAEDADGNPLFQNYAYLPAEEATIGLENVFMANIGMIQPIYTGGKIRELNKLAEYGENLFVAKKELTHAEVILSTDEKYWKVISLLEKVELTTRYKKMLKQLLEDLNNLYEEGIITKNEILKATVKYNEVDLKLLKASNGLKLARMALNQTIGFPLDTVIQLSDSLEINFPLNEDESYTDMALANRPELNMVNSTLNMAESGEKIMRSRYLPDIGLTASYMVTNPNPYNGFEKEFGGDWNIGVFMNIPLFHFGDRKHTLQAMRHETKAAEQKYLETRELIALEVQQILFKYSESIKKVELTHSSLEQAEENLKLTRDSFDEGMVRSTELLEAQTMWQQAYAEYIEAKTEVKVCESELLKVTGQLND
ncbi:MAG: TolC family protein [Bacteroidales bacterium]|jgi:outer membrane protein TolC|nr:TolC family protein [Bacteroidales bacterium]